MGVNGIYGLSGSGLDIESMVKVGMMSKQNEYNKMQQKLTTQTWTKEAFNTVYSDLATYNYSTLSQYKMQSTMNAMGATSTNTGAVTVTANGAAAAMTHSVTVNSQASNAYLLTKDRISRHADEYATETVDGVEQQTLSRASSSIYLRDVIDTSGWDENSSINFTINDGENEATVKLTYADVVTNKETLYDLAALINNAKTTSGESLKLTANYDATNDAFAIYNKSGGAANKITITSNNDETTGLLSNLGMGAVTKGDDDAVSLSDRIVFETNVKKDAAVGTDGSVTIDGKNYTTTGNTVTASNVIYTITGKGSSNVTVTQDTDAIIEKVKSFVDDYNKLLDGLYEKYSEVKYSDYKPLTDAQKEQMSEEQVEKWEKKAKSGMLYHDATIGKILDKMRTALATPVEGLSGKYNSAFSLGIDTRKTNGHIELDEDKLKKALAAEPECVYAVFGTLPEDDDYAGMGVAQRLGDVMVSSMREVKTYAGESSETADGSTLGNLMQELQTKMSNFKTMMAAFESKLYKKYDALEVALSQLGTQLNYITGGQ